METRNEEVSGLQIGNWFEVKYSVRFAASVSDTQSLSSEQTSEELFAPDLPYRVH